MLHVRAHTWSSAALHIFIQTRLQNRTKPGLYCFSLLTDAHLAQLFHKQVYTHRHATPFSSSGPFFNVTLSANRLSSGLAAAKTLNLLDLTYKSRWPINSLRYALRLEEVHHRCHTFKPCLLFFSPLAVRFLCQSYITIQKKATLHFATALN